MVHGCAQAAHNLARSQDSQARGEHPQYDRHREAVRLGATPTPGGTAISAWVVWMQQPKQFGGEGYSLNAVRDRKPERHRGQDAAPPACAYFGAARGEVLRRLAELSPY